MAPRPLFPSSVIPQPQRRTTELSAGTPAALFSTLSPEERHLLQVAMLGGAGANISNLLAQRPNAGIGQLLLAAGSGALGGTQQGVEGIHMGRSHSARAQVAERELALKEDEAAHEKENRARREQIITSMPPEQAAIMRMAEAGVPAAAINSLNPQPQRPQIFGSAETGYFTLDQQGSPKRLVAGAPPSRPGGGLTDPQQRFNAETAAARRQLDQLGVDRDTALLASQEYLPTGLPNPDYNPNMASLVRKGSRRMYGDDPGHESWMERIYGAPTPADPVVAAASDPDPASSEPPSAAQRVAGWISSFFGDESAQAGAPATPAAGPSPHGSINLGTGERTGPAGSRSPQPVPSSGGKIDRAQLRMGTIYALPDGRTVRWTGGDFEVVE
jgi:hypothetical protein